MTSLSRRFEDAREASLLKRLDCHKSKKDPNLKTRFARFDCVIELTMAFGAPPLPVIARDGPIEEDPTAQGIRYKDGSSSLSLANWY